MSFAIQPVQPNLSPPEQLVQLQIHIGHLENALQQLELTRHSEAQQQEEALFALSQSQEELALQLEKAAQQTKELQTLLSEKETHLQRLQETTHHTNQQNQHCLQEIDHLAHQLKQEREKNEFLSRQLEQARARIIQLNGQMQQRLRGRVAPVDAEQQPDNPLVSIFRKTADLLADVIWTGIHGFPQKMFPMPKK